MTDYHIVRLEETTSTNDVLKDTVASAEVMVATAEFQTAGRGQSGGWQSNRGENLIFSILVEPEGIRADEGFILSMATALAMKETIGEYLTDVWIKWPNDIYCNGCKIVGTLIENTLKGKNIGRCIIGTGLNINQVQFPQGLAAPASSMKLLQKEQKQIDNNIDREVVLIGIVERFCHYYDDIKQGTFTSIQQKYHEALYLRGIEHEFKDKDGNFHGTITHVEPNGHLHITDTEGQDRSYGFKEVKLIHKG